MDLRFISENSRNILDDVSVSSVSLSDLSDCDILDTREKPSQVDEPVETKDAEPEAPASTTEVKTVEQEQEQEVSKKEKESEVEAETTVETEIVSESQPVACSNPIINETIATNASDTTTVEMREATAATANDEQLEDDKTVQESAEGDQQQDKSTADANNNENDNKEVEKPIAEI